METGPAHLTFGQSQKRLVTAGQESSFAVQLDGHDAIAFDVQVKRVSTEPNIVVLEVRQDDQKLERERIMLSGIDGRGEVVTENLIVQVSNREAMTLVAQSLEGDAEVTVTVREALPPSHVAPHDTDNGTAPPGSNPDDDGSEGDAYHNDTYGIG